MKGTERRNTGFYKEMPLDLVRELPKATFTFVKIPKAYRNKRGKWVTYEASFSLLGILPITFECTASDMEYLQVYYNLGDNLRNKFRLELHYEATKGIKKSDNEMFNGKSWYRINMITRPENVRFVIYWINEDSTIARIKSIPDLDAAFKFRE